MVIANAGISVGVDSAERADLDVMRAIFETNNARLAATFHPFLRPMRERGRGTLVGIASVAAVRGLPGHGAYCASKAGVVAYCESLRGECRPYGVRVVTLLPGYVATPLTSGNRYAMPFLLSPDEFARRAMRAIEAGASRRVIPWQMGVAATLLRVLPDALLRPPDGGPAEEGARAPAEAAPRVPPADGREDELRHGAPWRGSP